MILQNCTKSPDLQIVVGDGLSETAVCVQVPKLLPLLQERFQKRGWSVGQTFCVRNCRVGIMNEIGELLKPRLIVLLIGERPGLATAESLSAYMAYSPCSSQTDADRNLVSNIHSRGTRTLDAVSRIDELATKMISLERSGSSIKLD